MIDSPFPSAEQSFRNEGNKSTCINCRRIVKNETNLHSSCSRAIRVIVTLLHLYSFSPTPCSNASMLLLWIELRLGPKNSLFRTIKRIRRRTGGSLGLKTLTPELIPRNWGPLGVSNKMLMRKIELPIKQKMCSVLIYH